MGIGTLGFLKGASGTMLSSIEARDAAEAELKKQKQLIKFRNDIELQNEMVKATTFQIERDPGTGKLRTVGYNSQGKRLDSTARDSTESEIAAKLQEEEDREYTLGERERKTKRADQVYNYADEDQRMQREKHGWGLKATKAQIDASNRSGRSLDGSKEPADTMGVRGGKQLVAEYSTLVAAAVKEGLNPGLVEQWAVRQVANTRTGDEARQKFVQSLRAYIDEANARKRQETDPSEAFDPENPTFNWR